MTWIDIGRPACIIVEDACRMLTVPVMWDEIVADTEFVLVRGCAPGGRLETQDRPTAFSFIVTNTSVYKAASLEALAELISGRLADTLGDESFRRRFTPSLPVESIQMTIEDLTMRLNIELQNQALLTFGTVDRLTIQCRVVPAQAIGGTSLRIELCDIGRKTQWLILPMEWALRLTSKEQTLVVRQLLDAFVVALNTAAAKPGVVPPMPTVAQLFTFLDANGRQTSLSNYSRAPSAIKKAGVDATDVASVNLLVKDKLAARLADTPQFDLNKVTISSTFDPVTTSTIVSLIGTDGKEMARGTVPMDFSSSELQDQAVTDLVGAMEAVVRGSLSVPPRAVAPATGPTLVMAERFLREAMEYDLLPLDTTVSLIRDDRRALTRCIVKVPGVDAITASISDMDFIVRGDGAVRDAIRLAATRVKTTQAFNLQFYGSLSIIKSRLPPLEAKSLPEPLPEPAPTGRRIIPIYKKR